MKQNYITVLFLITIAIINCTAAAAVAAASGATGASAASGATGAGAASDSHDDDVQFLYKAMGRTGDGQNTGLSSSETLDIQNANETRRDIQNENESGRNIENEIGRGDHRQWSPASPSEDHTDRLISFATEPGIPLPGNMIKFWMQRHFCKWQTYSINVTRPGCDPVPVINRMCYGACGSITVGTENGLVHELCESCAAVFRDEEIRLNCEGGTKMTTIKVVDHCECRPCEHRCN